MQAAVITRSRSPQVLTLREIPTPTPRPGQVLIEVRAASLNKLDSFIVRGLFPFLPAFGSHRKQKVKVPGADLAGRVLSAGPGVLRLQPGDAVYGAALGRDTTGAFAEYACVSENNLAPKPSNLSFTQAAAVPIAAITALQGLRDHGELRPGQSVLIDGASGGLGTFAVQIARALGGEVTAVCSPGNVQAARTLGAHHVIDYTREDYTRGAARYDLILAANTHHSIFRILRALRPGGTFVMAGGATFSILQAALLAPVLSHLGSKRAKFFIAKMKTSDLLTLKQLLETSAIVPSIERTYPLREAAEALRHLEAGHCKAKLVLTINNPDSSA